MALHVFGNIVTPFGTAANNRAETEGNITTLQKLIWQGQTHSTVSAEAIRFALRRILATLEEDESNRIWDDGERFNRWQDWQFTGWTSKEGKTYIDDDLLGFMTAEAAKTEADEEEVPEENEGKSKKPKKPSKGSATVRRAVLELTRAVSLTPWAGDVTFNAASPGATPSASKGDRRDKNPVPYGTEVHATRFQYGFALTPERLRVPDRAAKAIQAICGLGTVAGNHGRFLFDFSPDSIVLRITQDPAPRLLYCFDTPDDGGSVDARALLDRVRRKDVAANELLLGGEIAASDTGKELESLGAKIAPDGGIKAAGEEASRRIEESLATKR